MAEDRETEILVERAKHGDRSAFEELFESHRSRLLERIGLRLSRRLRQRVDPEDILQDALCKAFESFDRFRWQGPNSFYAWVSAIVEHLILNATKNKQLKLLQLDRDLPRSTVSPGKRLTREERYERLRASLETLTPDQRKAVVLARIDGLGTQEIARRLDRSEDSVRQLLSRALKRLKKSFGDTGSLHLPKRSLSEEDSGDE